MNIKDYINELEKKVKILFHAESSGHDIYHLKRVLNLALHIQEKEGGDRVVIGIAAFLHDIHRIIQNETGIYCTPKDSLEKLKEIVKESGICLPQKQLDKVLRCIEYHEEYGFSSHGKTVNDIETLILQDADNLDAIGAIGIGRTFAYSGANNIPMYEPETPLIRDIYEESGSNTSTVHHFYSKLLKLKDNMNTNTAKEMARRRHEVMEKYLEEFFVEWKGEK
jgi:uncharacterized protein